MMRCPAILRWAGALILAISFVRLVHAERDLADVAAIAQLAPSRNMGSSGRSALDQYVYGRFKATGFDCGRIVFPTAAFVPGACTLRLSDGRVFPLHSLAPNTAHPGNLPGGRWSGDLVDLRQGAPEELQGIVGTNAAALLDMDSRRAWVTAVELGVQVLIFAGSEAESNVQAISKLYLAPLSVPRFYLTHADAVALRQAIGARRTAQIILTQGTPNRWERIVASDDWVIVPGRNPERVVHLQAYKDAASIVPDFAPGAESACNLALLLRLLDYYTKNVPPYTLVFSAVSDHCNAMRGEEMFASAVFPTDGVVKDELKQRERELSEAAFYAKVFGDTSPENIARLRSESSSETGRTLHLKAPLVQELDHQRNQVRTRLAELQEAASSNAVPSEEQDRLEAREASLVAMMSILQRWGGTTTFADLSAQDRQELVRLMQQLQKKFSDQREDAQAQLDLMESNARLRKTLNGKSALLFVSLDLTFGNDQAGFFFQGANVQDESTLVQRSLWLFARLSVDLAGKVPGGERFFADTLQNTGGVGWKNYLADRFGMAASVGNAIFIPSVTLSTVGDSRERVFTPDDTLDRLPAERTVKLLDFSQRYLIALLAQPELPRSLRPMAVRNFSTISIRYRLRQTDPYSVEIPGEPVVGGLFLIDQRHLPQPVSPARGQVISYQVAMSDRQGEVVFCAVPVVAHMEAYGFSPDFERISAALDANMGARRLPLTVASSSNRWCWDDGVALLFDCVQTDLVGMNDGFTRRRLDSMILLDALHESSPDHFGYAGNEERRCAYTPMVGDEGINCIFTERGMPFKIVAFTLLLVNSSPDHPFGKGFLPGDAKLRTLGYTSCKDMLAINGVRLAQLESKAIRDPIWRELYTRADSLAGEAQAAREGGDPREFLRKSIEARSYAWRSYDMVWTTLGDLIRAVAAFLALVIPFCMMMTKLTVPWTDIRAQIGVFVALFAVMAAALAFLHPAFSLSQTPMMVLLAFVMIGLAVFVMLILYGQFDAGLQRLVAQSQGVQSTEGTRKKLADVAFSVGVSNMRRRRVRTMLTAATIVLVTFTMLSVMSVSESVSPFRRVTSSEAPYSGVMFAQPGLAPIRNLTVAHVGSLLHPYGLVVRRSWTQRLDPYGGYMPLTAVNPAWSGTPLVIESLLGLQVEEDGFIAKMPLVAGRWFSRNDAREVILSVQGAACIGITPNGFAEQEIMLRDDRLRLVGLVDDAAMGEIRDQAQMPLLPLESLADPETRQVTESGAMSVKPSDAEVAPVPSPVPLPAAYCAVVPVDYALTLADSSVRTIALKGRDASAAWAAANQFLGATNVLTYVGVRKAVDTGGGMTLAPGQYSLGPPKGTSLGGVSEVVIPICLAATIILNTMLGAVMERRKEIAVYNSIGLNPTHVFLFFVAEAGVFGIIGSVAGYLIGQGLAQAIVHFNLFPGVNLNYSSTAVMLVICGVIVTVVISTLYPAYVATRAAVPSGQRRWKLPAPEGDELHLEFPFCYSEEHLPGVLAYLDAFMDLNSEASSGQFLAQDARFGYVRDIEARRVRASVYSITPVPFDLGVNQRMEIYGYYDPEVRGYVVSTFLVRLKGDRSSWLLVNQPFLESLRARLLSWRSQSGPMQEDFCRRGRVLFEGANDFPMEKDGGG